jgi:hypothetical protein
VPQQIRSRFRLRRCVAIAVALVAFTGCGSDNDAGEVTTTSALTPDVVGSFLAEFNGGSAAKTFETTVVISCSGKTFCTVTFENAAGESVSYESVRSGATVTIDQFVNSGTTDCVTRSTTAGTMTVGGDTLNGALRIETADSGAAASCANLTTSSEYEITGTRQHS